ncbi:Heterogeneous nuclear ribonucleoprotein Q [Euphorbia peplus]|nr:Heterogeneous nuclear ribonucleoprotein Q [Euphorbia peplus]
MRTRNSDASIPATPTTKSAINTPSDTSPMTKPDPSTVEEETKVAADANSVTPQTKVTPRKKTVVKKVVKVVKKSAGKTKTPVVAQVLSEEMPNAEESVVNKDEELKEEAKDLESLMKTEEHVPDNVVEPIKNEVIAGEIEEPVVDNVEEPVDKEKKDDPATGEVVLEHDRNEQSEMQVDLSPNEISGISNNQEPNNADKEKEVGEETKEGQEKLFVGEDEKKFESVDTEKDAKHELQREDDDLEYGGDEGYEEYADRVDLGDDFVEEDPEEMTEEAEALEDEQKELTAVAKMRKIKKEYEIFVGGLDQEAREEDVKRIFEKIGEVVEVRLHKNLSMNRSKGYAFVKYADKEHVKRALSEMKNPVICGKRCGTAPSDDNDTLFLGNICNTWTKEAIRRKLKDYGVEGVESITLVADVQHEGRSRGFAFLEFSCHADAMHAYKRLQKPDVVFGHPDRTAKVAFAEPIQEPDPEIMAQVKTVFLDGLPPHWDEDIVRGNLRGYGEIVRIVLARNMSTAKRKDFGFVDFTSHEAAVACIERLNNTELTDGYSKTRVKARLSNPMPKTQAVKGGMCGGFLINRAGPETSSRFGRGFGRGGRFNRGSFQHDRGFYQRGRGQPNRMVPNEYDLNNRYDTFHGRQTFGRGGRRGPLRGGYHPTGRGAAPSRSNFNRPWYDDPERGHREHPSSRRHPFPPEEVFDRPYVGRQFDDPYFYDDGAHGMKRPFYMTDRDFDFPEPSRVRPRLDYPDPAIPFRGTQYRDNYGTGPDHYSHGYYGPEYGAYPPYYRDDRPYGSGYYY